MKHTSVLVSVVLMILESESQVWKPLDCPLVSVYPCKNTKDIAVWFEPGWSLKQTSRYYVYIKTHIAANSVTKIAFDAKANITITLRSDNNFSRIPVTNSESFSLRFADQLAGLSFKVTGTRAGVIPYLTNLTINDEEYCESPNVDYLKKYAEIDNPPEENEHQWSVKNTGCGTQQVGYHEPPEDGPSKPGEWPWHVAVFHNRTVRGISNLTYACGGTLISDRFVLTASHCILLRTQKLTPEKVKVKLGKYNLLISEEESVEMKIDRIITHEGYMYSDLSNDIALLRMEAAVRFTQRIQPACLWRRRLAAPPEDTVVGVVTGWGFTNDEEISPTLQQVNLPKVSHITCLRSNPPFFARFLHANEFCAGYHNNGTSPCNGDSGGGYLVFIPAKKQDGSGKVLGSWYITGVLAKAVAIDNRATCDENQYVVFSDVAKHEDWIDRHLNDNDASPQSPVKPSVSAVPL